MTYENFILPGIDFQTFNEAEKYMLNYKSTYNSYDGIFQTSEGYHEWYTFNPPPIAKKFIQNPNREDIRSPHTEDNHDILKLWITKENGQYLKEPKLVWTKEKGQIKKKQKQKPEPTLEETIKNYLKKQRKKVRT